MNLNSKVKAVITSLTKIKSLRKTKNKTTSKTPKINPNILSVIILIKIVV